MRFKEKMPYIRKRLTRISHKCKEDIRRLCSVLLCAALFAGSMPVSSFLTLAAAGEADEPDHIYEIESVSLTEAICEAVSEGYIFERELKFMGDAAEEYDALFDSDGTLYELDQDTLNIGHYADREKDLDLRVFVRISGDIPLDEAYEADGSEEVIFLLQNRADDELTVVTYIDDKESEWIKVPSADQIEVSEEENIVDITGPEDDIPDQIDESTENDPTIIIAPSAGGAGGASHGDLSGAPAADDTETGDEETDPAFDETDDSDEEGSEEAGLADENTDKDATVKDSDGSDERSESNDSDDHDESEGHSDKNQEKDEGSATHHDNSDKRGDNEERDGEDSGSSSDSFGKLGSKGESTSEGKKGNSDGHEKGSASNDGVNDSAGEKTASVSSRKRNLLTASAASGSDADKASPSDTLHSFNCTVYEPVRLDATGAVAFSTTTEDLDLYGIVLFDATQVLEGSGSIEGIKVRENDKISDNITYILYVEDVPTNTPISLYSSSITLISVGGTGEEGEVPDNLIIYGNLYYVESSSGEAQLVAYLMLDDDIEDDTDTDPAAYVLTAYSEDGDKFDMDAGYLVINIPADLDEVETADIWQIQTNTLCYLDEENDNAYTQEIIEAVPKFYPLALVIDGYEESKPISLEELVKEHFASTGDSAGGDDEDEDDVYEFYYGYAESLDLTSCTEGEIIDGKLYPLDANNEPVYDVKIYMVYDWVYSFDVEITDVVNEHTEDNGDTYLWVGDTFYIDQYHEQGTDGGGNTGYTRSQGYDPVYPTATNSSGNLYEENKWQNSGVWVQLGRVREREVNEGIYVNKEGKSSTGDKKSLDDYKNVSYEEMLNYVDMTGYDAANAEDTAEENAPYGIVGPYKFKDETDQKKTTVRITGHIGDEFTQTEAFGSDVVYMVINGNDYDEVSEPDGRHYSDWINLGCHASDKGFRSWFYWINDYYKLNNHQDEVEYIQIYKNDKGEVHLQADEIGDLVDDKIGKLADIWEIKGLYTKRYSVVKDYMLDNMEALKEGKVFFYEYSGWMDHIQLRTNTTVEVVINGVVYNGTFQMLYGNDETTNYSPIVIYSIKKEVTSLAEDESIDEYLTGTEVLERDNDQETKQYTFVTEDGTKFYVDPEFANDPDYVSITVTLHATGTLYAQDGSGATITYDKTNPLEYTTTLTEEQLKEAIDDCPNNQGYDVAINLADAIKTDSEGSILLTKVWNDSSNALNSRDDVTYVTVSLERSEDGVDWVPVPDENGETKAFTIRGNSGSNEWYLELTGSDLDLTYLVTDENGNPVVDDDGNLIYKEYYFRIVEEQAISGVKTGFDYVYSIGEFSMDKEKENKSLIIMNSLEYNMGITGEKVWEDEDGNPITDTTLIPEQVVIAVYQIDKIRDSATEKFCEMVTVTQGDDGKWEFSFTNLPQAIDEDGQEQYEYVLYELDAYGNKVADGETILLNGQNYRVSITFSGENELNPDENEEYPGTEEDPDSEEDLDVEEDIYTITNTIVTTEITLQKEDSNDPDKTLASAEFSLTREMNGITYYYSYSDEGEGGYTVKWVTDAATIETGEDGTYEFHSLPTGTYTLTETRAPDGYNILIEPISIVISLDESGEIKVEIESENTENVTVTSKTETGEDGEVKTIFLLTVDNSPGRELPKTGGSGTVPYTLTGMLFMAGSALLYLVFKRRGIC